VHSATVLEPGDTTYLGVMHTDGKYVEVRVANVNGRLLVTASDDDVIINGGGFIPPAEEVRCICGMGDDSKYAHDPFCPLR
jgi:hypothetical protein